MADCAAIKRIKDRWMNYRPEIDGLRAIAVLPVILFHAGLEAFSGGFVGVDVFFVISGYLIATLIISEMKAGDFRLLGFYERFRPSYIFVWVHISAHKFTCRYDDFDHCLLAFVRAA